MASTYNSLGIQLMATGENAGTWGTNTNNNLNFIMNTLGYISGGINSRQNFNNSRWFNRNL